MWIEEHFLTSCAVELLHSIQTFNDIWGELLSVDRSVSIVLERHDSGPVLVLVTLSQLIVTFLVISSTL